jgi:glucose/arabinose dehydrogenase
VRRFIFALVTAALSLSSLAVQPVGAASLSTTLVDSGFNEPVFVTNAGDSRLFVVQRSGQIMIIHSNNSITQFLNISGKIHDDNEQGLLGLAFPPNYASSGLFYVYYTVSAGNAEVLAEYKRSAGNADIADPNSERRILVLNDPYPNHNGGWMAFKGSNLFLSLGDGGSGGDPDNRAQDLNQWWGKIVRINPADPDGTGPRHFSVPGNNPFVNKPGLDPIWSYGLRNPWRCSFDSKTGQLWCGDVGQNAYEEVDRAKTGRAVNFGWRKLEGRHYYNWPGHTMGAACSGSCFHLPLFDYPHNNVGNGGRCAVTGGYVSRRTGAALYGKYIFGDYCSGEMWVIPSTFQGGTPPPAPALDTSYNISSFGQGVDGSLYVVDLNGSVYRIDQS